MKRRFQFRDSRGGTALAVRVVPRARRDEIAGIMDDGSVRIRLTAPPVEGKANAALIEYLAELTGIARSRIEIVAGHSHRQKLVSFQDLDGAALEALLMQAMGSQEI